MTPSRPSEHGTPLVENQPDRLDGWKQIAEYIGRSDRQAKRWADEEGMPVYRDPGGEKGRVYALRHEIDDWRAGRAKSINGASAAVPLPRALGRRITPAALAVTILAGGFIAIWWYSNSSGPASQIVRVSILGRKFTALDEAGKINWSYTLPNEGLDVGSRQPGISHIEDLDGDGRKEVLISTPSGTVIPYDRGVDESRLFCFDETGRLRWSFEFKETLTFVRRAFEPPWHIRQWLIYGPPGRKRLVLALHHNTWWPSVVVVLSSSGRVVGKFVNSGIVVALASLSSASGPKLLLGGVSNEHRAGILAVIDAEIPSGHSPDRVGSEFECKNCPRGSPLKYFVFPRSDINETRDDHNRVFDIDIQDNQVIARTYEDLHRGLVGIYEFSCDLRLQHPSYSDGYWEIHRELQREGKIRHSKEYCPAKQGPGTVRIWNPQDGWSDARTATAR